ncbi:stress response translation initiation inhibitor YciH [Aliidiomarina maris]|uniref:Stress response translation initiation inhibitor YciH n=1 Tax=Aliidiomarina maris TaxID=531312 RepID=A0A327X3M5_9GAMM|nr:stress response translation initiation inhibitor YciH [Aliidiomarina maris]MCL5049155.1 stress response translation initiation inhibitor YciH [Bacillota bacterium]RAK01730.1 translation initiation factor 1 (eIF-1/SUI1) [Aliidiomarina maris]RUO28547.1 stress response translation initiation inhibitor YciH [Aliidiomarina maris]
MSLKDQLSQLVYSTDAGRIDPAPAEPERGPSDGIVRIQRETKGRKGKGVTIIRGLALTPEELKQVAKQLKKHCGVGGSVKGFDIEIQGDQRDTCKAWLERQGHHVKLAGG